MLAGISGPKKRPREAAVNFGFEVSMVVMSVLFSGSAEVGDGAVLIGEHCFDPLRNAGNWSANEFTDPLGGPGSERDFYTAVRTIAIVGTPDVCQACSADLCRRARFGSGVTTTG